MTNLSSDTHGSGRYEPLPELSVQVVKGVCVLRVNGELDTWTTPPLRWLLSQELSGECPGLVVDLSGCAFMGSSGLAALVAARDLANDTTIGLALAGMTPIVTRALRAAGLEPLFDIYASEIDALTALTTKATGY
ncbi:MAG TPA: STAS domain-containing protein [Pseudonocardia sp.]|jgi:anti-sigma B factor antagonist